MTIIFFPPVKIPLDRQQIPKFPGVLPLGTWAVPPMRYLSFLRRPFCPIGSSRAAAPIYCVPGSLLATRVEKNTKNCFIFLKKGIDFIENFAIIG